MVIPFEGNILGPSIYIQANLHGPEIFGVTLIGKYIKYLESLEKISGNIILVPCANPIGVQQKSYNALTGRWNSLTGNNWNRIFTSDKMFETKLEKKYYQKKLDQKNISIEDKLAAHLKLLSSEATHVIDIHTTGTKMVEHVFTHKEALETYKHLFAKFMLIYSKQDAYGAFDESHVLPFQEKTSLEKLTKACTWEVYHHGENDGCELEDKLKKLINCVEHIWTGEKSLVKEECDSYGISSSGNLYTPSSGYITWLKVAGSLVKKDEVYATSYKPWCNEVCKIKAEKDFKIIGIYGIQAVSEGDPVAFVVYT